MHCRFVTVIAAMAIVTLSARPATAGPFLDPSIDPTDPSITAWADSVVDYTSVGVVTGDQSIANRALGASDAATVSLGDLSTAEIGGGTTPGTITLGFSGGITDGAGNDFVVFENTFEFLGFQFAEFAFVEVSSDGVNFVRFASTSLTTINGADPTDSSGGFLQPDFGSGPLRDFAGIDPTNVDGLAGKWLGVGFDLSSLATDAAVISGDVDLSAITQVRIVDIPGDGSFVDSTGGNPIFDSHNTEAGFNNGGFDLDAIGVINSATPSVPEPGSLALFGAVALAALRRLR